MAMRMNRRMVLAVGWIAVLGAGLAPRAEAVSATGGTVTNYYYRGYNWTAHIFTNSGTLTVSSGGDVEVLVVGGGGGGGSTIGGGGGGGGYITTNLTLTATPYTVTIGAGGAGGVFVPSATYNPGVNGSDSVFGTVVPPKSLRKPISMPAI